MPKLTARTEQLFVVEEDTMGVLKKPAGSNVLRLIDDPTFDQMIAVFLSKERKKTYDYTKRFPTRYPAGKGSFRIYIKPSGTPGVEPVGDLCLKGLFGRKEVSSAPARPTAALETGTGVTDGSHQYAVTFITDNGVADPIESPLSDASNAVVADGGGSLAKVKITKIALGGAGVTARNIYRTKAGGTDFYLLHQLADNSTTEWEDDAADGTLTVKDQPAPAALAAAIASGAGVDAGVHEYAVSFFDGTTETTLSPIATVTIAGGNLQVELTAIPLGGTTVTARRIYRTKKNATDMYLLHELADNTTAVWTDNAADSTLTTKVVLPAGGHVKYLPIRVEDGLPPTFSVFFKVGDMVLQHSGFIFEKGTSTVDPSPNEGSAVAAQFDGEFFKQHIASPSKAASDQSSTDLVVTVADATQFLNNPFIEVLKADGTTHGPYHIASIDYSTDVLTIDDVGGFTDSIVTGVDTIRGWLPTAVDSGNIVNWAFGITQENLADIFITGGEWSYMNGYKVIDNEKNGQLYPSSFMINGLREVRVNNVSFYFDADLQGGYFYQAQVLKDKAWELPFGDQYGTPGNIGTFYLPKLELETSPKIQSAGGNELTIVDSMIALEKDGSDSCYAVFS